MQLSVFSSNPLTMPDTFINSIFVLIKVLKWWSDRVQSLNKGTIFSAWYWYIRWCYIASVLKYDKTTYCWQCNLIHPQSILKLYYQLCTLNFDSQGNFAVRVMLTYCIHQVILLVEVLGPSQYKTPSYQYRNSQYITMTSWWPRLRLKSPASRLFTQPFIQT